MSAHLELGDIIKIISPTDNALHNQVLLITYIDNTNLTITNDKVEINLIIKDGILTNKSIESVELLNRSDEKGYVMQKGLVPGVWINIQFTEDVPIIITAKIVNTDEDMIEVITWPDKNILYFDFEYKGPLKNIIINTRGVPMDYALTTEPVPVEPVPAEPVPVEPVPAEPVPAEPVPAEPVPTRERLDDDDIIETDVQQRNGDFIVKEKLKEIIFDADAITFGEELDSITQMVEVSEDEMRYGIEAQTNDMMDDFLSNIPTSERSYKKINEIHTIIERYIQLRKEFSTFDEQNNPTVVKLKGIDNKPLLKYLKSFDFDIKWLSPVVTNIKKVYDVDGDSIEDIQNIKLIESITKEINATENIIGTDKQNNVYTSLYNNIDDFYTPFLPLDIPSSFSSIDVNSNINATVNNFDTLESSVVNSTDDVDDLGTIKSKFINTINYVPGLQKLVIIDKQGSNIITKVAQMTPSNTLHINGILIKSFDKFQYSNLYLPTTNMLQRVNIHNTKQYFITDTETDVDDYTANIDTITKSLNYNEFGVNQKLLLLDTNLYGQENIYNRFLEHVIPRIKDAFLLVKDKINDVYSFKSLIKELEPFLIYHKDLTFKQYQELYNYVINQINKYKKNFSQNKIQYNKYSNLKNYIFEKYQLPFQLEKYPDVISFYNILESDSILTVISKASIDGMNCLTSIITGNSKNLYTNINIDERITQKLEQNQQRMDAEQQQEQQLCDKYIISNKYNTEGQLYADNGKEILYHREYDNTRYDIVKEFPKGDMNTIEYINYLAEKLKKNVGLNNLNATRDAEAMVLGKRVVRDGDIAVLSLPNETAYYRRENNTWSYDEELTSKITTESTSDMCNMQNSCIYIKKQCLDAVSQKEEDEELLRIIVENVKEEMDIDYEQINKEIETKLAIDVENLSLLHNINKIRLTETIQNKISHTLIEDVSVSSPYSKLLYTILAQDDFSLRLQNIYKFYQNYTVSDESNPNMYICKDTHIPILPSFLVKLSEAYTDGKYMEVVDQICKEQGELSDDGDKWVDRHSGFTITMTDLHVEEGYDSSGYKIVSREILEKESTLNFKGTQTEYNNPNAQIVYNIVSSISGFLGINITASYDFIIKHTLIGIQDFVPSPELYNVKIEKSKKSGKKIPSYEFTYQNILLLIALTMTLISIQTQIPSVKVKKTFPGCVKSFSGFPLINSDTDLTGITYIACVANKIKSKSAPWNTILKSNSQSLTKKLVTICKKIIKKPEIKYIIKEKQLYLSTVTVEDASEDIYNLENWIYFLPPLIPLNIAPVKRINLSYYGEIEKENLIDTDKINFILYKNYYLSLAIQSTIQLILNKEELLLRTNSDINYLENACCHSDKYNALNYFVEKESSIIDHIEQSLKYEDKYNEYMLYNKPYVLVNTEYTKAIYPALLDTFSEKSIYYAFLHYCKFNTGVQLSDNLLEICKKNESNFNTFDSIEHKINVMKGEGLNYTESDLYNLLLVINKQNLVHVDINIEIPSSKEKFEDLLEYFSGSPHIDDMLIQKLLEIYTVYGTYKENKSIVNSVYDYISVKNDELENEIYMFLEINGKNKREIAIVKTFFDSLGKKDELTSDFTHFELLDHSKYIISEDNTVIKYVTFINNIIKHFFKDTINIIVNKKDYTNCYIPNYWKLSEKHQGDIQAFIEGSYSKLSAYYDNDELNEYLDTFETTIQPIILLLENTPFDFSESNDVSKLSIFNFDLVQYLYKYYLLSVFKKLLPSYAKPDPLDVVTSAEPADETMQELIDEEKDDGDVVGPQLDLLQSGQPSLRKSISDIIITFCLMLQTSFNDINMNKKTIMKRVLYSKEKEKEGITTYLETMSIEEREVENIFKTNKLGRWNKGLTKGLVEYVGDVYDVEREDIQKYSENASIYLLDATVDNIDSIDQSIIDQQIETDVNDLSGFKGENAEEDYDDDGDNFF
jgi:hypothetical protein